MNTLENIKENLQQGAVYRRQDIAQWSNAVDRHLILLCEQGILIKLAAGLYACPKKTVFGDVLPDDTEIIDSFLKGDDFLTLSPNDYNALNLGTTQLYNKTVVYNHRRHQPNITFGKRVFDFHKKRAFPKSLSREFLLVDMVDNLDQLAEDKVDLLERVKDRVGAFDQEAVLQCSKKYASPTTRNFFTALLAGRKAYDA